AITPTAPTDGGGTGDTQSGFPWIWLVALAVVISIGVAGTRTPVLAGVAGGMTKLGWNAAALTLYERLVARQPDDTGLRLAQVRCLAALGKTDGEARSVYRAVLDDDAPADLVLHLAALYWEHGFVDADAPFVYELATRHEQNDPDLWEAFEACLDEDSLERRIEIARRLLGMDRPSSQRLLLVAEQVGDGAPDEAERALILQVANLDIDDEDLIARRGNLLDRMLPIYQEFDLAGDDAIAVRETALFAVGRRASASGGHLMTGPRALRAPAILAELSRMFRRAGDPDRLFQIHVGLLRRFDGESAQLAGLLRAAGELGIYSRALAVIQELYPLDGAVPQPSLAVRVATEFMVAGSRHLRERALESGALSADLPSLTFFERARVYLSSVTIEDALRPDVRERLSMFLDLYLQADDHLLALDAVLARLLWGVGDHPNAVAVFLWSCGFEPHVANKGVLLLPAATPPPCEEFFPEDHGTLASVVADRPLTIDDVDELSARASGGTFNERLALLITGREVLADVRQHATTRRVPIVLMDWSELAASLEGGHGRQTFRRHVRGMMRYSVPPDSRSADLEDARLFGRDPLQTELGERFRRGPTERMLLISGVRGAGKSTLLQSCLRSVSMLPN
ncbi:MAG: hypothetical protein QGH45_17300, partial [Myxococcota bacterium]|nr:hypothetical protein [Myxococcota bacterium]